MSFFKDDKPDRVKLCQTSQVNLLKFYDISELIYL